VNRLSSINGRKLKWEEEEEGGMPDRLPFAAAELGKE